MLDRMEIPNEVVKVKIISFGEYFTKIFLELKGGIKSNWSLKNMRVNNVIDPRNTMFFLDHIAQN